MTREKAHVALALVALLVAVVACKYSYTPPGSAVDASADVIEEREIASTGSCTPNVGNHRCALDDKAVWCKPRLVHDGPRASHWEGDWTTFKCPDCSTKGVNGHIKCSDYAVGDTCDPGVVDEMCTRDKLAIYRCDWNTKTWKVDACPGGCETKPYSTFITCKE